MSEDEVVAWLCAEASALLEEDGSMGTMEKTLDRVSLECRRRALEQLVQKAAAGQSLTCPRCRCTLNVEEHDRKRTVNSAFGLLRFARSYGFCPNCGNYVYPADVILGLQERAPASPRVQEICALTALRAPAGQSQEDVRRLTGLDLDASTLHREARRQGERALVWRDADVALTQTLEGVTQLAARACTPSAPFTLIIEIDAWMLFNPQNNGKGRVYFQIQ